MMYSIYFADPPWVFIHQYSWDFALSLNNMQNVQFVCFFCFLKAAKMLREEDKCNLLISDYYNCHCAHVSMIMPFFFPLYCSSVPKQSLKELIWLQRLDSLCGITVLGSLKAAVYPRFRETCIYAHGYGTGSCCSILRTIGVTSQIISPHKGWYRGRRS